MAEIALQKISKRFPDNTEAVRPLDLTIEDGELFILVGPSGCGKSTLLKIIVGLESPTTGEVRLDGERITRWDPKDRNMAMVFQSYALYPHLTVRENMAFPLKLVKLSKREIDQRVTEAARVLGLEALLERKPAVLSGGQRQRVAMGRAIVRQPAAFLLDEPLSNLDAKLRVQMRTELARLQRRLGTTTVYVTHDQTEAMTLGDRIAVLRKGEIQQVGTPQELYRDPVNLFVAGFIGSPAMNFLPATIKEDRLVLPMSEFTLPERFRSWLPPEQKEVVAGIRPEHFRYVDKGATTPGKERVFNAQMEVVEWLGADLYVHFDVEAWTNPRLDALQQELELDREHGGCLRLVARVGTENAVVAGEAIALDIDPEKILLFDPKSGERIDSSNTHVPIQPTTAAGRSG